MSEEPATGPYRHPHPITLFLYGLFIIKLPLMPISCNLFLPFKFPTDILYAFLASISLRAACSAISVYEILCGLEHSKFS